MVLKPWQTQEKKRFEAYEDLDKNGKKVLLLDDLQGTGKSIICLKIAFKNNRNTILLANNHELAVQFSKEWMKYNESFEIGYMVARNRLLNEDEKELISTILGIPITQDYACTRCANDNKFREFVTKGYMLSNECKYCEYKHEGECIYYLLKAHLFSKLDSITDDNRIFLLVKPYIYTGFVKELLKKHVINGTIFDEGFLNLTYTTLSYTNIKTVNSYIKFIDHYSSIRNRIEGEYERLSPEAKELKQIMLLYNNIVRIWFPIRNIIKLLINNDRSVHNASQKKTSIYNKLVEFKGKFGFKEVKLWYENLKYWISIEHAQNGFDYIPPNKFTTLESILEDVYKISNDELKHRLMVDKDDLTFTYVADTREKIIDIINYKNNKTLIPSATLTKEMFEKLLPVFKELYLEQRDDELKSLFKAIYIYTRGTYPKYSLYDALTGEFSDKYDNLLKVLKKLILRHKKEKILIIAFKIIEEQLKKDLKEFFKKNNINEENIKFEHYFNIEGLNKYEDFDVGILFGACGLPKELIIILSRLWDINEETLTDFFIKSPMFQCMERLRSVNDPHKKIIYQLSNIINEKYPAEQIIYFNKIVEVRYKGFLEKLKKAGISNTEECLEMYNECNYKKIKTKQQMNSILNELVDQLFLDKIPIKKGSYRPLSYYKIIKKI